MSYNYSVTVQTKGAGGGETALIVLVKRDTCPNTNLQTIGRQKPTSACRRCLDAGLRDAAQHDKRYENARRTVTSGLNHSDHLSLTATIAKRQSGEGSQKRHLDHHGLLIVVLPVVAYLVRVLTAPGISVIGD